MGDTVPPSRKDFRPWEASRPALFYQDRGISFMSFKKLPPLLSKALSGVPRGLAAFLLPLLFWEGLLRTVTGAGWMGLLYSAPFLLALSLLCTALSAWEKKLPRHLTGGALLLLLFAYYLSQIIYFRTFGSLYTVSMMGMGGDALLNFGWALGDVLKGALPVLLLSCLPLPAVALLRRRRERGGVSLPGRGLMLLLAIAVWIGGVGLLRLFGTDRLGPYYVYRDPYADTDSSSDKLGALPTTLLSGARYLFGSGESVTVSASEAALPLPAIPRPAAASEDPELPEGEGQKDYGMNIREEIDFSALEAKANSEELRTLCRYFAGVEGTRKNEYTGLLEGYNLIYICAESYSPAALDPRVTPTLCKMAGSGIVLSNYYNSYLNTTTNGEFTFLTGLWPDVNGATSHGSHTGSFNLIRENFMPYSLARIFREEGAESFAYHGYYGEYYNRKGTHTALGYEAKFMDAGLSFSSIWPTSDRELLDQTMADYLDLDRFHAYYMTFSGHGPYNESNVIAARNLDAVRELLEDDEDYSYNALCYLACNLELERAMADLLDALEETGKLDRTLIVLAGDHFPYYLSYRGFPEEIRLSEEGAELYHSGCILYFTGLEEPIRNDAYCCNVDILPTVLNLLGIDYDSRLIPGQDIFSDGVHMAQLYNREFITEYLTWMPSAEIRTWSEAAGLWTEEEKENYLNYMTRLADNRYGLSLDIVSTDFYRFVWEESGLPTE